MGRLTTHVLDTARGRPGSGIAVRLFSLTEERELVASSVTNADGRTDEPLLDGESCRAGKYELEFDVGAYFSDFDAAASRPPFLDDVVIRFQIADVENYHVPLLVSPWSYSTYRGS